MLSISGLRTSFLFVEPVWETPKGQNPMVANHSHKAKARELMALSNGKLSYTQALGLAANLQVRLNLGHIDS